MRVNPKSKRYTMPLSIAHPAVEVPADEYMQFMQDLHKDRRLTRKIRLHAAPGFLLFWVGCPILLMNNVPSWIVWCVGIFGFVAMVIGFWHGLRRMLIPRQRTWLRERGFEVCAKCGFWMDRVSESVTQCLECGTRRQPMSNAKSKVSPEATE